MTIQFNVKGPDRKPLIKVLENATGRKAVYKFMPTCAYEIGIYTLDKNGALTWDETDPERVENLLQTCIDAGFMPEEQDGSDELTEKEETETNDLIGLTISIPRDGMTDIAIDNLQHLVAAKANLISKALGTCSLEIETDEEQIHFPWFAEVPDADTISAATAFVEALTAMARNAKRVTATEKEVGNEKYAFRCFLLRLGFIGDEFKAKRKTLLRNLSGSSAFKSGHGKDGDR